MFSRTVVGYSTEINLTPQQINKQASHCNEKKTNSKRVQELSSDLYFAVFVKVLLFYLILTPKKYCKYMYFVVFWKCLWCTYMY